jgi:hypothetical protein
LNCNFFSTHKNQRTLRILRVLALVKSIEAKIIEAFYSSKKIIEAFYSSKIIIEAFYSSKTIIEAFYSSKTIIEAKIFEKES